jgi:hypothetical protein
MANGAYRGTYPNSINIAGVIAGTYYGTDDNNHSFVRTTDGTVTAFDVSGAYTTAARGIDRKGTVVGFYLGGQNNSFIRTADGTVQTFRPKGSQGSGAYCINAKDLIAGYEVGSDYYDHGFVRTP